MFWYYERRPFGHDVDHLMLARIASLLTTDKTEPELMPRLDEEETDEQFYARMFPGADEYADGFE